MEQRRKGPMGKGKAGMPRPKVKKGMLKRLLSYVFGGYGKEMVIVVLCLLLSSVSSVAMSVFMQRIIDECVTPGITAGWEAVSGTLIAILLELGAIYVVGVLCSFLHTRIMANVTQGTLQKLRDDMFVHMQSLPIKYFDTHATGDIMSTYTNDTDAIRQVIGGSIPNLINAGVIVISLVSVMLYYSVWMTLVVGLGIYLMFSISGKYAKKSRKFMLAQQKTLAEEEGFVEEMMNGLKVVKVFTHEEESKKDFDRLNEELYSVASEANRNGNVIMPIMGNLGNISYVVLALFGGILYFTNATNLSLRGFEPVTLGIVITYLGMFRQLTQNVRDTSQQITSIAMGLAGAERIFDLIDEQPEQDEGYCELVNVVRAEDGSLRETREHTNLWAWKHPHKAEGTVTYTELKGDIELEMVDFAYVPGKPVLEDVCVYAKPGQKIALVGATGAGKTTITNLINRFYDIPDGKIRFDGININKIRKPDLRRSLGIVLQDVNLFTGTVMDNIRYGRLDATDEECVEAAKLANAHDFITRLPEGYNTMLTGNGAALSQGQRQLLSIARAAVANTPAMILDEATSSIDTRTEALVQDGMDKLMAGRTVFVIAHRLSTVRNADCIIVLDHGRVIERGSHDSLIEKKGTYYQLYTGAFELD